MGTKFKLQIQFVNEINLHHLNKIETQNTLNSRMKLKTIASVQ